MVLLAVKRSLHASVKLVPDSPNCSTAPANSPATPVKSFFQERPAPINSVGTELRSVKGCGQRPDRSKGLIFQVGELTRQFR